MDEIQVMIKEVNMNETQFIVTEAIMDETQVMNYEVQRETKGKHLTQIKTYQVNMAQSQNETKVIHLTQGTNTGQNSQLMSYAKIF